MRKRYIDLCHKLLDVIVNFNTITFISMTLSQCVAFGNNYLKAWDYSPLNQFKTEKAKGNYFTHSNKLNSYLTISLGYIRVLPRISRVLSLILILDLVILMIVRNCINRWGLFFTIIFIVHPTVDSTDSIRCLIGIRYLL